MITLREAEQSDTSAWIELRLTLWPEDDEAEHRAEIERYFARRLAGEPWIALMATGPEGNILGFAECSVRSYAEGCATDRVGYLEGWFVAEDERGRGVGRALVEAGEAWAREQGCTEFASDAEVENEVSRLAHGAVGFTDVGLVRCFRKDL